MKLHWFHKKGLVTAVPSHLRISVISGMVCLALTTVAMADADLSGLLDGVALQHKWNGKCEADHCKFASAYAPPFPFNYSKIESYLSVNVTPLSKRTTLNAVMHGEIEAIRDEQLVVDYMEDDHRDAVDRNIAAFKEKISGRTIGFIKYRSTGFKDRQTPLPISVTLSYEVTPEAIYCTHLVTFFAAHWDETNADQLALIRAMIAKFGKSP